MIFKRFLSLIRSLTALSPLILLTGLISSCGNLGMCEEGFLIWPGDEGHGRFTGESPDSWDISWLGNNGDVLSRTSVSGSVAIESVRGRPVVVRAIPVWSGWPETYTCHPAGCVVPAYQDISTGLVLKWEEGFAAEMLLTLARGGIDPGRINLPRFLDAVHKRSGGRPWHLDSRHLVSDIISGRLWIYSFKLLPLLEVILPLPPGTWYSDYPPEIPLIVGDTPRTEELTMGVHAFIRPSDSTSALIYVDERGGTAQLLD